MCHPCRPGCGTLLYNLCSPPAPPIAPPEWLRNNPQDDIMADRIGRRETSWQIKRMPANSAPGPDRISYRNWKYLDPQGIYNRIPSSWKESITILIHKRGDQNDITNWRPICLQNTLYKLYAAIIAQRLADWTLEKSSLTSSQRGFLPYDGCTEHNFLLQSIMQDARRSRRNLSLVWIDLANSIPRHILLDMLGRAGLGGRFLDIVKDIYSSSTTKVKTDNTSTPPITMDRGVKQGCPLSPLLFNFVLDGALRRVEELQCGYRIGDHTIKALGYADDICLVTEDKQGLEGMLEALHTFCQWAGLKVKVEKCASLTMVNRGQRKYTEPFSPRIGGQAIPALQWEERYHYLGCSLGANPKAEMEALGREYIRPAQPS